MTAFQSHQLDTTTTVLIAEAGSLERLMFNRNIVGTEFLKICGAASTEILSGLVGRFGSTFFDDFAELVVLSKGLCYQLGAAAQTVLARSLDTNFIATRREEVGAEGARIGTSYTSFTSPANDIIIADTVASGATICAALEVYRRFAEVRRLIILSFAGSALGACAISGYCAGRGIELTLVYGLAVFGLARNGFDLSFLDPDTITADRHRRRATDAFQGRPVSAVGWDFGSQAYSPRKYAMLCWIEERYWNLVGSGVFQQTTPPTDARLVLGEINAYRTLYPTSDDLAVAVAAAESH